MDIVKYDEAKKIWHQTPTAHKTYDFAFELDMHKKLLNFFNIGEFYYYIYNCTTQQMEMVSESVKQVLGITHTDEFSLNYLLNIIHAEDLPYCLNFEKKSTHFFSQLAPEKIDKYKVSYDYRVNRKDGKCINLLQQLVVIHSGPDGEILRFLGIHTDITHLKSGGNAALSFIGMDGEPTLGAVQADETGEVPKLKFTKREQQILAHLSKGYTSAEIADALFLSKLTVDTHRRNMLKKTNSKSILSLTLKYAREN